MANEKHFIWNKQQNIYSWLIKEDHCTIVFRYASCNVQGRLLWETRIHILKKYQLFLQRGFSSRKTCLNLIGKMLFTGFYLCKLTFWYYNSLNLLPWYSQLIQKKFKCIQIYLRSVIYILKNFSSSSQCTSPYTLCKDYDWFCRKSF